ncbi:carboxypeptidase-like regulatory domain-containing protein [Blastopirellula retiformator]|uniref:Carboxypeptidase regulatory-like domain-containing protein n=1 Tax=Blastopirellula retiformator TaxID=2527970 RepID=A0A5C5V8H6_9BACT|nr:carboxypeptidase-like regulatory domain-containing protein [Blastopirellula retiformator]TWT34884.1 hypothetical protein Enr8_22990 [Blastopirellula retiformator]
MLRQFSTYGGAALLGGLLLLLRYHSAAAEPEPASAEGVVTYQGEPVSHAFVTFKCRGMAESLYGQTDETGHYKLYSRMERDLPIGKYAVTIVKRVTQQVDRGPRDQQWRRGSRQCRRHWRGHHDFHQPRIVDLLPEHYGDGPTSGLIALIEPGKNVFDFTLTDEAPPVSSDVVAHDQIVRLSLN